MTTQTEALKLALEALEYAQADRECPSTTRQAITAIKEALAQPEQEPVRHVATFMGEYHGYHGIVGWDNAGCLDAFPNGVPVKGTRLYTTPPQRKPLTDEHIDICIQQRVDPVATYRRLHDFARAIEAAHGIKE